MERRRNRQGLGHLGTTRLAGFHGTLNGAFVPGDHGLPIGIEVHRLDHFTLRRFGTGSGNTGVIQAKHGSHGTGTDRYGFLHGGGTQANQGHSILESNDAGRNQRRVFTETVPGQHGGLTPALFQPQTPGRNTGGQHHRLRVDRLGQHFGRTFGNHRPQIIAKRGRSLVESSAHHAGVAIGGHHANALRALAGKYESKRHSAVSSIRIRAGPRPT